jgi:hypothetical protein
MFVAPFRVFGIIARPEMSPPQAVLYRVSGSFRVSVPLKYDPYRLDRPTVPLAISSAVWFSLNGVRRSQFSFRSNPLFELRLLIESCPTIPSLPTAVRWLLSWASGPYSTSEDRRSTSRGFSQPATFRLQGLLTLLTAYSLRSRAGLISYQQRSWDSPFGVFPSRKVFGVLAPE